MELASGEKPVACYTDVVGAAAAAELSTARSWLVKAETLLSQLVDLEAKQEVY